jgi:hypothetical protein
MDSPYGYTVLYTKSSALDEGKDIAHEVDPLRSTFMPHFYAATAPEVYEAIGDQSLAGWIKKATPFDWGGFLM